MEDPYGNPNLCSVNRFFTSFLVYLHNQRAQKIWYSVDAEQIEMRRRIRAQSNLTEYAPVFLILLGYAEYGKLPTLFVHVIGVLFILGRIIHTVY